MSSEGSSQAEFNRSENVLIVRKKMIEGRSGGATNLRSNETFLINQITIMAGMKRSFARSSRPGMRPSSPNVERKMVKSRA